jgi:hypothetical protein
MMDGDRCRPVSGPQSKSVDGLNILMKTFCAGLTVLLLQPVLFAAEPKLPCDTPNFDFGYATQTQNVRHAFLLRNTGDAPVSIERVHNTCGCTTSPPIR